MPEQDARAVMSHTLREIPHPEMPHLSLGALGMLPEIDLIDNTLKVTAAVPFAEVPIKDDLVTLFKQQVAKISPVVAVEVEFVVMDDEARENFMKLAKTPRITTNPGTRVKHVVAVMSGKGGVGKSSVAAMLASALHARDFEVGVLDADITGPSIPKMFGATAKPMVGPHGVEPVQSRKGVRLMSINLILESTDQAVIWRGPLISRVIEQFWSDITWGSLDYLIIDLPPGTSDAALTVAQSLPLNGVILVTSPQELAGMVVRKAAGMVEQLRIPLIGLIENMSFLTCPDCGKKLYPFGQSRSDDTAKKIQTDVIARLPLDSALAEKCDSGHVEDYQSSEFAVIVDRMIAWADEREQGSNQRENLTGCAGCAGGAS
ncbi:MAG: Mrp/NBP35 family ATP-binding protein [Anaerolineales bacterium]|nr:Mrp/NBP35 family ATP-binding protein [Anaerolineales bacterium]